MAAQVPPDRPTAPTTDTSARTRDVEQLVAAAMELFAERGPDRVSLRQVAARAGVNYGLVHQYIGTKEDLLTLVFRRASAGQAEEFARSSSFEEAVRWIMRPKSSTYVRMLAHALLEGRDPGHLMGPSPAMQELRRWRDDARGGGPTTGEPLDDARVQVAMLTAVVLGWRMFGPFLREITGIDELPEDAVTEAVFALARAGLASRHGASLDGAAGTAAD